MRIKGEYDINVKIVHRNLYSVALSDIFKRGETDMGDKGKKDKGKREQQKKAQRSPKEKRRLRKEKRKK